MGDNYSRVASIYAALSLKRTDTKDLEIYISALNPEDPEDAKRLGIALCAAIQNQISVHMLALDAQVIRRALLSSSSPPHSSASSLCCLACPTSPAPPARGRPASLCQRVLLWLWHRAP